MLESTTLGHARPVVLVTGPSRGIGRAIAVALARAGFDLVLWSRRESELKSLAFEVADCGAKALFCSVDVCDPKSVRGDGAQLLAALDSLSGVVINAGVGRWNPLDDIDEEEWAWTLGTNLGGAFRTLQVCLPWLRRKENAQVVVVGSDSSLAGFPGRASYCASKWGLRGFVESVREELRASGIRVTHLATSRVDSYFRDHQPGDRSKALAPEDLGRVVAFLFSLPLRCEVRDISISSIAEDFGHR